MFTTSKIVFRFRGRTLSNSTPSLLQINFGRQSSSSASGKDDDSPRCSATSPSTGENDDHPYPQLMHRNAKRIVGILGGGITGLSTAYYLVKKYGNKVHPIIFEKSGRVGGWMKTVETEAGSRYEMGPRTIRPAGISGLNTLDLIQDLQLEKHVLFVQRTHPTSVNRFLYANEKLVKLPADTKSIFKKQEPFSKPLIWGAVKDLFAFRKLAQDDSIYNFAHRRFGREIADYLIDPMIRGICGGDAKKISVKFLMKDLFELEQQYGSVIVGQTLGRLFRRNKCKLTDDEKTIGFSKIAVASLHQNWAVWSLEPGLEMLAAALEKYLVANKVEIRKNTTIRAVNMCRGVDELDIKFFTNDDRKRKDSIMAHHVISTLPCTQLYEIMKNSKPHDPELFKTLGTIESEDMQVTGLTYDDPDLVNTEAFGFLVPSNEKSVDGLLGIVFDSNVFPQGNNTVITVMSRSKDGKMQRLNEIKFFVEKTLGITKEPKDFYSEMLRNCIPQYNVGHYGKVDAIRKYLKGSKYPMSVAGASWDGVSVNDCIYGGRKIADEVGSQKFPPSPPRPPPPKDEAK